MEGDIVEIKNGILFINGVNFDKTVNLNHNYHISIENFNRLPISKMREDAVNAFTINDTTIQITIDDEYADKKGILDQKVVLSKQEVDKSISLVYDQNWNKDNFGPLKIPKGKAFVLGDNRDNSEDSRYIGLIDFKNIKGKIILY